MNGTLFFSADDGTNGKELWKSDGTTAGTVLVANVNSAAGSFPFNLTDVNGTLFFSADDGTHGVELWKSDGTAAGTVLVAGHQPGLPAAGRGLPAQRRAALLQRRRRHERPRAVEPAMARRPARRWSRHQPGIVENFVPARPASNAGCDLLRRRRRHERRGAVASAARPSGRPGQEHQPPAATVERPTSRADIGSLFFSADDAPNGSELWKSDGTAAGTARLYDVTESPFGLQNYAAVGNLLFFNADDGTGAGNELWKSDGTSGGTTMVRDINPGAKGSSLTSFTGVGNTLFFVATGGALGHAGLWKSDGTEAGTVLLKDFSFEFFSGPPLGGGRFDTRPSGLTNVGGVLLFVANGWELWQSDGTATGTTLVKALGVPDGYLNAESLPRSLTNGGGLLFLAVDSTEFGSELWRSDGTASGTHMVKDIRTGGSSSSPQNLTWVAGTLFFTAFDDATGWELWKSDGTEAGTTLVKDIYPGGNYMDPNSSSPGLLTNVNGTVFFSAGFGGYNEELWRSDGTEAGTTLVRDINAGAGSSSPRFLTNVNGTLYLQACDATAGCELWKSDGTEAGTVRVRDIYPGMVSSSPASLVAVGDTLFFSALEPTSGRELWKSDGTAAGTTIVEDVTPGTAGQLSAIVAGGPGVFFDPWDDPSNGQALWILPNRFSIDDATVVEGHSGTSSARFAVSIWPSPAFGASVAYATADGSAVSGNDFRARSGTLSFAANETSKVLSVPVIGDTLLEATETFTVNLASPTNGTFGDAQGEGVITDDDTTPRLSIADVTEPEGSASGWRVATVPVTLSAPSGQPVSVTWRALDGTAVGGTACPGSDYIAPASGVLTIPTGSLHESISLSICADSALEDNEAFAIQLSAPVNATLAKGQAQYALVDDDKPGAPARSQPTWHNWFAVDPLETPSVGDFDGDGRTDIVTFTRQNPNAIGDVYVALSDGARFGENRKWHDWFAISTDEQVVIGDYDGDGKDDIATWLGTSTRQVYVALSTGSGMSTESVWLDSIGTRPSDVLLSGDANGDGRADLISFARQQGRVYVALSEGRKFAAPTVWHGFFAVSTYERPRVADVTGDGRADIVTFATNSPTAFGDVYVAVSDGTRFVDLAGVPDSSSKWHDWFAIRPTEEVRTGDVDGDGTRTSSPSCRRPGDRPTQCCRGGPRWPTTCCGRRSWSRTQGTGRSRETSTATARRMSSSSPRARARCT